MTKKLKGKCLLMRFDTLDDAMIECKILEYISEMLYYKWRHISLLDIVREYDEMGQKINGYKHLNIPYSELAVIGWDNFEDFKVYVSKEPHWGYTLYKIIVTGYKWLD